MSFVTNESETQSLYSNREGLVASLKSMELATVDPHSQKECTEIHKIPKFGVQRFKNVKINKEMYGHPDAVSVSVRIAIHFFVNLAFSNACILLTIGSIYTKLWDFVRLGLHLLIT